MTRGGTMRRDGFWLPKSQQFLVIAFLVVGSTEICLAASDGEILLEFKKGVTSDPNNTLASWQNSSATALHFCDWTGVTCDNNSRVMNITLRSYQLEGRISSQLGALTYLKYLDLRNNLFTGPIPAEIGNCSNLVTAALSSNSLNGSIPATLGNLRRISLLDLSFNKLTGTIPLELGNSSSLTLLLLNSNFLNSGVPKALWELRNLTTLYLSKNHLTSVDTPSPGSFNELQYLDISNNNLSGQLLPLFSNATKLVSLALSNNRLTGVIPAFGNLRNLSGLYLSSNFLEGNFPSGLLNLATLIEIKVADNKLTGTLPNEFGKLSSLGQLDLSGNSLEGEIPDSLGHLNLLVLDLQGNNFRGPIPSTFGLMSSSFAIYLNLSRNMLTGPIPPNLGNLIDTSSINLSTNQLSGSLPSLVKCYGLQALDLSNNSLSGDITDGFNTVLSRLTYVNVARNRLAGTIGWVAVDRTSKKVIIIRPGNDALCLLSADNLCLALEPGPFGRPMLRVLLACVAGLSLLVFVAYWICFQHFRRALYLSDAVSGYCRGHEPVRLTVQDIITATNGYDESQMIGYGGTSTVYKGLLPVYPFVIAVKKFHDGEEGRGKLLREAQIMRCTRHRNIVEAWGMTAVPRKVNVLVLEFADNGTLSRHLYPPSSGNEQAIQKCELSWDARLRIAIDVAAALHYLHNDIARGMAVIHGDLKPANIFLDATMTAKVGDFGLAKLLKPTDGDQRQQCHWEGTFGYSPPEHAEGLISTAGDVYSFGVVILELLTRTRPSHYSIYEEYGGSFIAWARAGFHKDLSAIMDSVLAKDFKANKNEIALLFRVGLFCTRAPPCDRPTMKEVVEMLHGIQRLNTSSDGDQQGSTIASSVPSIEELIYEASFTSFHMAKKKDWTSKFYAFDLEKTGPNPRENIPDVDSWFSLFQLDMRDSKLLRAVGFDSFAIKNIRKEARRRTKTRRWEPRAESWISRLFRKFTNRSNEESNSERSTTVTSALGKRGDRASHTTFKQNSRRS